MRRRGFLKTCAAAFCGAMLNTFPDFAPVADAGRDQSRFGVSGPNIIEVGLTDHGAAEFMDVIRRFEDFHDTPGDLIE